MGEKGFIDVLELFFKILRLCDVFLMIKFIFFTLLGRETSLKMFKNTVEVNIGICNIFNFQILSSGTKNKAVYSYNLSSLPATVRQKIYLIIQKKNNIHMLIKLFKIVL